VVKGGPNLEDLRTILFAGVFVRVLLTVGVCASVFWVAAMVGVEDAGGFPAGVAGGGVTMSYEDSNVLLHIIKPLVNINIT